MMSWPYLLLWNFFIVTFIKGSVDKYMRDQNKIVMLEHTMSGCIHHCQYNCLEVTRSLLTTLKCIFHYVQKKRSSSHAKFYDKLAFEFLCHVKSWYSNSCDWINSIVDVTSTTVMRGDLISKRCCNDPRKQFSVYKFSSMWSFWWQQAWKYII